VLKVRLDGFVLLIELGKIGNNVFYDIGVGEWVNFGFCLGVGWNATQTSQSINTINIHRATSTDSLPTTPSESQSRINFILDANQSIQHHRTRLLQIESVGLHSWLGSRLIWVPAVDVEGLDLSFWVFGRLLDCRCLRGRSCALNWISGDCSHSSRDDLGSKGWACGDEEPGG